MSFDLRPAVSRGRLSFVGRDDCLRRDEESPAQTPVAAHSLALDQQRVGRAESVQRQREPGDRAVAGLPVAGGVPR